MSEASFWTLVQQQREQGERQEVTREFEDPRWPGFKKSVTFRRISGSERISALAESARLVQTHLNEGHPWATDGDDPEGITEEGVQEVILLRWHQPEHARWSVNEWIGLLATWDTALLEIDAFASEVDTGRPLAPTSSSAAAPPASTPANANFSSSTSPLSLAASGP